MGTRAHAFHFAARLDKPGPRARTIYYRRLDKDGRVRGLPLYGGGSIEVGGLWNSREAVRPSADMEQKL